MAVIFGVAAIAVWAVATNQVSYVVTHGVSMNPIYYQGDLVFVIKADTYHVGEIAAYHSSRTGETLHRIIGGDGTTGYVFKGDNNESVDLDNPTADELIGHAVLHIPKGGVWLKPILSPTSLGMMGYLIVSSGAMLPRNRREIPRGRRKKKVRAMSNQGNPLAAVIKSVARMSPLMRVASGLVALLASLAFVLGVLGWMKPLLVREPSSESAQSMIFSYSAKVPKSPAYDGTVASSPDPIFRRLAKHVDFEMHYKGRPGTIQATATLTNGSGWHTSMSLVSAKTFSGRSTDAAVPLDLASLEDRADAAAEAIGIAPDGVTITVNATVTSRNADPFTATLNLQLDAIQLRMAEGKDKLVVDDVPAPAVVARQIGSIMTAAKARAYAVLLLLTAAVGGAAIAIIARRKLPLGTRTEIERRYPKLLVPVEPMASPPGKPVVSVDNFPALVRLAERYGQMILTWRRPDADDFVVRDEGITYRYRIPFEEQTLDNIELINRPNSAGSHRRKAPSQTS